MLEFGLTLLTWLCNNSSMWELDTEASSLHTQTLKTMKRSGSQYWEVRNSSGMVLVFHPDAEHENDSASLYQRSSWPGWTNKPLFVVLQKNRVIMEDVAQRENENVMEL